MDSQISQFLAQQKQQSLFPRPPLRGAGFVVARPGQGGFIGVRQPGLMPIPIAGHFGQPEIPGNFTQHDFQRAFPPQHEIAANFGAQREMPGSFGQPNIPADLRQLERDMQGKMGQREMLGNMPHRDDFGQGEMHHDSFDDRGFGNQVEEDHDRHYQNRTRDRDRDRRRDRDRDRDRDRRRNRDRDRDRNRDRSMERNRGGEGNFDNSYDYGNYEESQYDDDGYNYDGARQDMNNSMGRDRREGRGYDRGDHYGRDGRGHNREGEKWLTDNPTNTIMLRGLPQKIDEKDIRAELMMFGVPIKEVRLMKKKDTGASRGFAFVEFQNTTDAQRWMEHNQGQLYMLNQYAVSMHYSQPKTPGMGGGSGRDGGPSGGGMGPMDRNGDHKTDWICSKCGVHNFKRRDYCFKCSISREESEKSGKEGDGFDQVGTNPCNTLIFRGLDALTTEESIMAALVKVTALTVKNCRVMRDSLTNTSQGYAFIEMNLAAEASQLLESLGRLNPPLEIDGKQVLMSYSKNTFTTVLATLQQNSTYDYSQYYDSTYYQGQEAQQTGYYDQNGQYYEYSQGQYVQAAAPPTQTDSTNAAAAVAQAAIQQAQAVKHFQKQQEQYQKQVIEQIQHQQKLAEMSPEQRLAHQAQQWSTTQTDGTELPPQPGEPNASGEYTTYTVPDVSTYTYDEASGYYYDPQSGLYYDANSQYYYNASTAKFLYWDSERSTYLAAPTAENQGEQKDDKTKKEKDKKEKVKIAKKIAKDMEKWAKTLNAQKDAMKDGFKRSMLSLGGGPERESASADAGFAVLEKGMGEKPVEQSLMPPPPLPGGAKQAPGQGQPSGALVASYGGDSDEEDEDDTQQMSPGMVEEKMTDWTKMACLLCKRQFPSKEALQRHQQLSDLHKQNLDKLKASHAAQAGPAAGQYRDRAKERRQKYGSTDPPINKKKQQQMRQQATAYEEPTKAGLGQDNIGNKLLQKMGWSQGKGLGRTNQGIVDPIQAQRRTMTAGLGARGSSYDINPGDTYKDSVKKVMYARFHEMGE